MPCARLWSSSSPQTLTRTLTEDGSSSALPSELVLLPETSLGLQPGEATSHWLHAPLSILETPSLYSQGSAHDLPLVQFLISGLQWSSCARTQGSALNSTDKVLSFVCAKRNVFRSCCLRAGPTWTHRRAYGRAGGWVWVCTKQAHLGWARWQSQCVGACAALPREKEPVRTFYTSMSGHTLPRYVCSVVSVLSSPSAGLEAS